MSLTKLHFSIHNVVNFSINYHKDGIVSLFTSTISFDNCSDSVFDVIENGSVPFKCKKYRLK